MSAFREITQEVTDSQKKKLHLTEIMANADGKLFLEVDGTMVDTGVVLSESRRDQILRLLAGHKGVTIGPDNPSLNARLPLYGGCRFQGHIPPVVAAPAFSIRMPAKVQFTLDQLVAKGTITEAENDFLVDAIQTKKTMIVAGGTGSGKTTLLNALLGLITEDRIISAEDNPELVVVSPNWYQMLVTQSFTLRDAIKDSLRLRPDRILVGEIRDGDTALDFLKSSATGHPGSMATIHANGAHDVRTRLYALMQEVVVTPNEQLIDEAVDVVVFIAREKDPDGKTVRRIKEIVANGETWTPPPIAEKERRSA